MANIPESQKKYRKYGGQSMIVSPKSGEILAQVRSHIKEGFASAEIPIASFRAGRRLPQYPLQLVGPIFSQYLDEIPPNHMDLPEADLPKNGKEMKALLDKSSRWLNR